MNKREKEAQQKLREMGVRGGRNAESEPGDHQNFKVGLIARIFKSKGRETYNG